MLFSLPKILLFSAYRNPIHNCRAGIQLFIQKTFTEHLPRTWPFLVAGYIVPSPYGEDKLNRQLQHSMINVTSDRHINAVGRQAIVRVACQLTQNIRLSNVIGLYRLCLILYGLRGKVAEVSKRWKLFTCCSGRKKGDYKCIKCQLHAGPMLGVLTNVVLLNSHKNPMQQS